MDCPLDGLPISDCLVANVTACWGTDWRKREKKAVVSFLSRDVRLKYDQFKKWAWFFLPLLSSVFPLPCFFHSPFPVFHWLHALFMFNFCTLSICQNPPLLCYKAEVCWGRFFSPRDKASSAILFLPFFFLLQIPTAFFCQFLYPEQFLTGWIFPIWRQEFMKSRRSFSRFMSCNSTFIAGTCLEMPGLC